LWKEFKENCQILDELAIDLRALMFVFVSENQRDIVHLLGATRRYIRLSTNIFENK
jgi:hypothetical protein